MSRHFGGAHSGGIDRAKLLVFVSVFALILFTVIAVLIFSSGPTTASVKPVVVEKEEPEIKMVDVLVPNQDIDAGQPLEPALFKKESRPQIGVSGRVVRDFEEIKGHFSRSLIVGGQPLYRDYITNVRPTNALTANIPEGFRAVTISVDVRSSVEGFVRAGARVDVVWASKIRGQPGVTVIVQNARVLSAERQTDNKIQPGMPVPSTVTLLVTATDAQKIQLAMTTGSLSLNLRGDTDTGKGIGAGSITITDLLGGQAGAPAEARPDATINGTIKMRGPDGKLQTYVLRNGKMEPLAE